MSPCCVQVFFTDCDFRFFDEKLIVESPHIYPLYEYENLVNSSAKPAKNEKYPLE